MESELETLLLNEIKSKSQIQFLEESFILNRLQQFFLTNGDKRKKLETEYSSKKDKIIKSKIFKEVLKTIREEIGILYGSYLTSQFSKKETILEKYNSNNISKNLKENKKHVLHQEQKPIDILLSLHKSSKERIDYYYQVYSKIFSWYQPKKGIADLACGLNPLSYSEITEENKKNLSFYVSDLNPKDMEFLQTFFLSENINGIAKAQDITQMHFLEDKEFQVCDLVFFFKALDSFESIKRNISKEILEKIPQNHIVVSFPTKSLGSKKEFKSEKRNWFRNFLAKVEWIYEEYEIENEMFFLIEKNDQ
jgi:hypothetical protein